MNSTEPKTPRFVLWLVLIVITGILMLLCAEVLVRIVPGKWTSAFFYRYDPEVGTWHIENFTGDYISQDFEVRGIHINSFGMRDKERTLEKKEGVLRIAVLGDSMTEGSEVKNDETYSSQLEQILGEKVEVLNFGVSGFGTAHEYATYVHKVRQFKPDIVIVGFLAANDMRNNSKELEMLYNGGAHSDAPYLMRDESGDWVLEPVPPKASAQNPIILFLKRHVALYRFLWYEKQYLTGLLRDTPPETPAGEGENVQAYLARLSAPPEGQDKAFQEAWAATDELVRMLHSAVEEDGGTLIVAMLAGAMDVTPDPREALEKQFNAPLPEAFDIDYPREHMRTLSMREGISFLDLTPTFRAYRDEHQLEAPYFSYPHDGHWSKLGHMLAAETLATYLREQQLVP
jgi:lysophospholipase L1-like esterase